MASILTLNVSIWKIWWLITLVYLVTSPEDLVIIVTKKIHRDDTDFQRLKESFWIKILGDGGPKQTYVTSIP